VLGKVQSLLRSQKLLSFVSNGVGAALGLASFAFLARTITKSELGVWTIFMAVATLLDMLRNGLVGKPLIKFYAEEENPEQQKIILGSSWSTGIKATLAMGMLVSAIFAGIAYWAALPHYWLYVYFSIPLLLASLPMNMARWVLNARVRFDQMMWIRIFMQVVFFVGIGLEYCYHFGLWFIFLSHLGASLVASVLTLSKGWGQLRTLPYRKKVKERELVVFGKYSMGSLVSGSLLRNTDTFIIGIFLGEKAVALYEVPMRLVNLIDIPLRALVSYSFPILARAFRQKSAADFQDEFERAAGFGFLLLLPIAVFSFVFAEALVVLMGGEAYREAAWVMRMFAIYMGFTAIDRYWGVGLDVINKPRRNYYKVLVMLVINIVGDLLVVQLTDDVSWVAFVTIFTFSGGVLYGHYYLRKTVRVKPLNIIRKGGLEMKKAVNKVVGKP